MTRASGPDKGTASFDFRENGATDKQGLVDRIFDRVAERYDLMNDVMSGGIHRLWKSELVDWLAPPVRRTRRYRVLDIAGGTGDVAFRIARRSDAAEIVVVDVNPSMIDVGRRRADEQRLADRVTFVEGNAEDLPLDSASFEAVTSAFGIRNVPQIDKALSEMARILRPGGRLLILEFSTVDVAGLDLLYDAYSFNIIPRLGGMIVGDEEPYRYLVDSIRRFPAPERFAEMIRAVGLARVSYRRLSGGIAAIHSGWRL